MVQKAKKIKHKAKGTARRKASRVGKEDELVQAIRIAKKLEKKGLVISNNEFQDIVNYATSNFPEDD